MIYLLTNTFNKNKPKGAIIKSIKRLKKTFGAPQDQNYSNINEEIHD